MTMQDFLNQVVANNPNEPEFHQAVEEVVESIWDVYASRKDLLENRILNQIVEPERQIMFRVNWTDDAGRPQVNRAYRIQFNSALGPYKGGMRFHPSVNVSILKFLGFEQTFKNSLTTLAMGGAKGGSDFDPKGKSQAEIMRFCKSLMMELYRHIGADIDVPAGDIGVGQREVGYMFGAYNRIKNDYTGVFTGRSLLLGGSHLRPQATGYGTVYFVEKMLEAQGGSIEDKEIVVSGSGNVAQYAVEKATELGGKVVTVSDSTGFVHDPDGIDKKKWEYLVDLKQNRRGRVSEYAEEFGAVYYEGEKPWNIPCQVALPCATQNEINAEDAKALVKNGCMCVAEGANMPTNAEAVEVFLSNKVLFAPGKAANAGGVATSGFEMSQTSQRLSWEPEEVDRKLKQVMVAIHSQCIEYGQEGSHVNYVRGANVAGFLRVADAMLGRGF